MFNKSAIKLIFSNSCLGNCLLPMLVHPRMCTYASKKKKRLVLKMSRPAPSETAFRPGVSASVILDCFVGETKPCAFPVQPAQPHS